MQLTLASGQELSVPDLVTNQPEMAPGFVISIRKSGSTMVAFATQLIAEALGVGYLDVGSLMFYANVPAVTLHTDEALNALLRPGALYSGFRDYPTIMERSPLFTAARKVLYIRDPRDALVSEYFSNAYSHDIPDSNDSANANTALMERLRSDALGVDINQYVLQRVGAYRATATKFFPSLGRENILTLRYEDTIFNKFELVRDLCAHLRLSLPDEKLHVIAKRIDLRPPSENPRAFVRKVTPGDYKEKLTRDTIARLNHRLKDVMEAFGYAP